MALSAHIKRTVQLYFINNTHCFFIAEYFYRHRKTYNIKHIAFAHCEQGYMYLLEVRLEELGQELEPDLDQEALGQDFSLEEVDQEALVLL